MTAIYPREPISADVVRESFTFQPWPVKKISEVGVVQLGRQRTPKYQTGLHTRKYLRVANVYENRLDLSDVLSMDFDERDFAAYELKPGDILLNEGQSTELVGRPAMWRDELPDCCFQNTLIRFQADPLMVDANFALRVFLYYFRTGEFSKISSKTSNVAHLGAARFANMPFPLPPLEEQRRIAAILDQADALRDKRRQALAQVEQLTQSVFLDMFGDFERENKRWSTHAVDDLIESGPTNGLYKHSDAYGAGTPILRIDAFYDGRVVDLGTLKRVRVTPQEQQRYRLIPGAVVINRVNSIKFLGKCALIPDLNEPMVYESNMMQFTLDPTRCVGDYCIYALMTPYLRKQLLKGAKQAVNQASINQADVRGLQLPLPPLALQQEFARRVEAIERLKAAHRRSLKEMDALFASLQHRAFRGEL